jgi:CheY-like chemotaxis protein
MSNISKSPRDAHILLADDDPDTVLMYRRGLEQEGFRVSTASNGDEALEEVRRDEPDLVVLDLDMPDRHGLEVAAELRSDERTSHIPIAILSAWQPTEAFGSSPEEMGLVAWVAKHETRPSELAQLITQWLEKQPPP